MSRRRTDARCLEKIAVVGADTPAGAWLRTALEAASVPGDRVDLYGTTRGEAVLSEYLSEARLIQEPDLDELRGHGVVFLCETGEVAERLVRVADPNGLVIDLTGSGIARDAARLVHVDLLPPEAGVSGGVFSVPHYLAIALAEILQPIHAEIGLAGATAIVLRPAGDFGDAGVEELRRQTVSLLNFAAVPTEVFGRQLAFNCIPQRLITTEPPDLERVVTEEVARLTGLEDGQLALRAAVVPVFYGHAVVMQVRPREAVMCTRITELLQDCVTVNVVDDRGAAMPAEAIAEPRIAVSDVAPDGSGGAWLWAGLEEACSAAAAQGVKLARLLGHL